MSCWTKQSSAVLTDCKTDLLEKAIESIGMKLDHTIKRVANSWGNNNCDAALVKNGEVLPLGFEFLSEDGKTKANLVGDFYGTGIDSKKFIKQVSVAYSKENIKQICDENGYTIDTDVVNDKGEIVMEAWQYA